MSARGKAFSPQRTSKAMFNLGLLLHQRGELGEAETWWRRAAHAGDSGAMFNLGLTRRRPARRRAEAAA